MIQYDVLHEMNAQDVLVQMTVWHDIVYIMNAKDEITNILK